MLIDTDSAQSDPSANARLSDEAVSDAALDVRAVSHSYGQTPVLHGLNLTLPQGEYTCLLGDSGSGKTTLLKLIAGIERLQAGRIVIGGAVVADGGRNLVLPPERRNIGMVFQDQALWPHLTVQAHLEFPLRARGQTLERADLGALLERMGLAGLGKRKPSALSGGQRQRVGLARALASNPSLLLLDEPLSAVDAGMRNELRGYLRALFEDLRFSALHVTHDPEEAFQLGTRVGVMENGHLVQWARPEDLYRRPATLNVARLTGACGVVAAHCLEREGALARLRWHGRDHLVPAHEAVRPGRCWLLLRPDALIPATDGVAAQVTAARFQGDRWLADVSINHTPPVPVYLIGPPAGPLTLQLRNAAGWVLPAEPTDNKD
ncbi:MAG: ABC transporter ATP-binding protein [Paracoccaceae bacterium]|nr:ABC transporter ATP-binding protein [Paracoccaceae bacterium]